MSTNEAEKMPMGVFPLPEPPPLPQLPASGPRREQMLRAYAERAVDRLGAPAVLWLIAELEEALADAREQAR